MTVLTRPKTVALVGNMNNNFFALMRYLRDLGIDAHLLMFADEAEHFLPENDTWRINQWRPYIRTIALRNSELGLLTTSATQIRRALTGFDAYIGCGAAPAYFSKAGLQMSVFIPYAYGIEFYGYHRSNWKRPIGELLFQIVKRYQRRGIQEHTRHTIAFDKTIYSKKVYDSLSVDPVWLPIPMVYNREILEDSYIPQRLRDIVSKFRQSDLVLFSHVSHKWWKIPRAWQGVNIKRNDQLIRGFTEFVRCGAAKQPLLVLVEYGYDVDQSKRLIRELGIEKYVLWLPLLSRKEIMYLLDFVDLGGAELGGVMWGGTGWEFLAKGVPFFQYVNMSEQMFRESMGSDMPPFLNVMTPEEIKTHMIAFVQNRDRYRQIGTSLQSWFNENNGISLAARYIPLLDEPFTTVTELQEKE